MATKRKGRKPLPIIIKDTREQQGYNFKASSKCGGMVVQCLNAGDYTVEGLEDYIIIERKHSVEELWSNFGKHRDRFFREIERMTHVRYKILLIEDSLSSVYSHRFVKMNANSIIGTLANLMLKHGIYVIFAGNHKMAHILARKLLLKAHEYWLEDKELGLDLIE